MKQRPAQIAPQLDAAQWIDAAFDALAEGGIDAVRVDPLAKRLGVTRGSFYWHFKDRGALHRAMLRQWRERASYMIVNRVERSAASAGARLERLLALPHATERSTRGAAIELAVRLWARRDGDAAKAVRHVDRTRLTYFAKLLQQHGCAVAEARQRAFLFYAALMGQAWIATENRDAVRRDLERLLLASS